MIVWQILSGLFASVVAFVRAYDNEEGITPSGKPKLEEWKKSDSPYEAYISENSLAARPSAALLFRSGRELGSVVYLPEGKFTMGTSCTNDIVITSLELNEKRLLIEVAKDGSVLRSESPEALASVNGHSDLEIQLVDQDECSFQNSVFYFLNLKTEGGRL